VLPKGQMGFLENACKNFLPPNKIYKKIREGNVVKL
jgi:hypothetical protein